MKPTYELSPTQLKELKLSKWSVQTSSVIGIALCYKDIEYVQAQVLMSQAQGRCWYVVYKRADTLDWQTAYHQDALVFLSPHLHKKDSGSYY